jgi:regulatory protein
MKIVKMTASKHVQERYYLELENGETVKVDLNLIAAYDLYSGRDLDEDELARLLSDAEKAMAKARALRIMGSRNMSRKEITDRLVSKGESDDVAQSTADWLESVGAVDDEEYAAMIVRHYSARGYGQAKIKNELYRHGIPKQLWPDAMTFMPDMQDKAYEFLCQRLRGKSVDRIQMKKATDALLRRGFSWEEARTAVNRYQSEFECETEDYE